jgi:pimeloyl-ACP methyl ester carboxylesterase
VIAHTALEQREYLALSPNPESWPRVKTEINQMWKALAHLTTAQLQGIRLPTTIADGQYDEFIKPEHTRCIAAQIPHATLVILPKVSHFAMIQDPQAFNRDVLEFFAR